jgi:hypothetical protein
MLDCCQKIIYQSRLMKLFKFLIPAAFVFLFAFTAHAQSTGAQEVIKTLLEQVLRIQTQLTAQTWGGVDFAAQNFTRTPSGTISVGDTVTFSGTVAVVSGSFPWTSQAKFCIDATIDSSACINSTAVYSVRGLSAGQSQGPITHTWTATAGNHTVYFCAERPSGDTNGTNNCTSMTFTVGSSSTQTNTNTTTTNTNTQSSTNTQTNATSQNQTQTTTQPTTTTSTNSDGEVCTTTTSFGGLRGSTTSTTCTDSGTTNTQTATPPDLSIINLARITTGTVMEGQYITFSGSVRNLGGSISSVSTVRFCLDNANCLNSTTGRVGSDQGLGSVPANSVSNPLAATLSTSAGSHVLYMCADVGKVVAEGSESNNCSSVAFSVSAVTQAPTAPTQPTTPTVPVTPTTPTAPSGTPDLSVQTLTRSPSGTIREGDTVTLSAAVRNSGTDTAGSSRGRFCIDNSTCASGRIGSDQSVSSLSVGSSQTVSERWTARAGLTTIYFCADIDRSIIETTEGNNCLWTIIFAEEAASNYVPPAPTAPTQPTTPTVPVTPTTPTTPTTPVVTGTHDLVAANISRIGSSGTIRAGDFVTFMGYIRNQGTAEAPDSWARFCVDNSNCLTSSAGRLNPGHRVSELGLPLPAGGSSPISRTWTAEAGRHTIYLCANTGTPPIEEDNKNNNCTSITIDVEAEAAPYVPPAQSGSGIEIGMTMPFYWESSGQFSDSNTDPSRLNYNRYLANLDKLKGKVDWVRIHTWSWLVLGPNQFNADGTPRNESTIISNPTFYAEGLRVLRRAINDAHARGFKVQLASADIDHRISDYRKNGQYVYSIDQLRTHYQKMMERMAAEFRSADSWVLFNESNQFNYRTGDWQGANDNNVIDHVPGYLSEVSSLLNIARTEIKKTNPNTIIIASNFAPWEVSGNAFLSQQNQRRLKLYYDAVMPYVDMVSFNWYVSDQGHIVDTSKIDFELGQLEKHVDFLRSNYSKPIFIDEFGIPVCRGATNELQITWLNAVLRKMQALGIPKIMLYTMQDDSQFGLGSNDCEYNFGFINQYGQQRPSYNSFLNGTVQDVREGKTETGVVTPIVTDPIITPVVSTQFCQATVNAQLGNVPSNQVFTSVSSRNACLQHCTANIRSEDLDNWRSNGYNMCWYDNGSSRGFISSESTTPTIVTPTADERFFCQASVNSTLGPAVGNNPVRSVASREQCLDFCANTIRREDLDNWRSNGYNMCWFDKGFISATGSAQNFVMMPSVAEALAGMKWSSQFISSLLQMKSN